MFQAHLYFLGPRLRQNHFSKDPCFLFFWKWYLQRIRALICSLWLGSQFSRARTYTFIHLYLLPYFYICICIQSWVHDWMIQPTPVKESRVHSRVFLSLSVSALSSSEKSYLRYLWYIHLVVQTKYTQKIVSELLPIPLWEHI